MESEIRRPVVAGAFYPAKPDQLSKVVSDLLGEEIDRRCPTSVAPCALIVPHAGYPYSGLTAAAGYRSIAALGRPSVVILLGANHTGLGGSVAIDDHDAWSTPLGDVPVARDIVATLEEAGLSINRSAFTREHSIEVQLPFLQVLWGSTTPIVPICVQPAPRSTLADIASTMASVLDETGPAMILASSDFSHYEKDEVARERDEAAIASILSLDPSRFLDLCASERLSICGAGAIATLLWLAPHFGLDRASLAGYSTSGDVTGDRSAVVGYAAISIVREVSCDD